MLPFVERVTRQINCQAWWHRESLSTIDITHPPAGTWEMDEGMGVVIGGSHRSLGAAIGAMLFTVFWNGITSIFVFLALSSTFKFLHLPSPDWFPNPKMNGGPMTVGMTVFLWLFLTPFIVIGVALILLFLSTLGGKTEMIIHQAEGHCHLVKD